MPFPQVNGIDFVLCADLIPGVFLDGVNTIHLQVGSSEDTLDPVYDDQVRPVEPCCH